jgi:hypothetical protein
MIAKYDIIASFFDKKIAIPKVQRCYSSYFFLDTQIYFF